MRNEQFNNKLNIKLAVKAINAAILNAKSLYEDAEILFNNKKYARSISLSILSIEEAGKPSILRNIILETEDIEIKKLWKSYRKHYDKNLMWILPDLYKNGARKLEELKKVVDKNSDHSKTLDNLKQLCFYSDIFEKGICTLPDNIANEEIAKTILNIAKISINEVFDTEESLEIWIKHLKPVWKKEMFKMKLALIDCYKELEDKKLIENGKSQDMINFLF